MECSQSMQDARAQRFWIIEVGQRSIQNFVRHSMPTYASALAYQGLFALFPFVIFVGLLVVVLQVDGFFDRLIEHARSQPQQQVTGPLRPVVEQARPSLPEEALASVAERLVRQGQEVAESQLLRFGIVFFAIWSASGVAWTLFEALNVVHEA